MTIRAMLAAKFEESRIQKHLDEAGFLIMQPKIDGMRVLNGENRIPLSRSGKEWKQRHLRQWLQDHPSFAFTDGEAVAGLQVTVDSFRDSMSGLRAEDGCAELTYYAFDYFKPEYAERTYSVRRARLETLIGAPQCRHEANGYVMQMILCPQVIVSTMEQIYDEEVRLLEAGWEGGMLRRNDRPYKFGRATPLDGSLTKLKRFEDAEAVVVGYEPWYHNANELKESPIGYAARSQHQEGKIALERLGAIHVELLTDRSVKFKIGVFRGIDHPERDRLWADRDSLLGRICTFSHQGYGGGYDVPRTPVFRNWRSPLDL